MKKAIITMLLVVLLSSCQRSCQKNRRDRISSKRNYSITLYNGGDTVYQDFFHGIVTEEAGNGAFYFKGDTLIEISGDYTIISW